MINKGKYLAVEKENNEYLFMFLGIVVICIITYLNIDSLKMPSVMNDEFGYLGNAAFFAGYNWSSILTDVPYYSYGYSLILAPLYILFQNASVIYIGVYIINTIFLIIAFYSLYYVSGVLFKETGSLLKILVCLVAVLNTHSIIMSGYALSETMLFSFFCLVSMFLLKYLERPSYMKTILMASLGVMIYTIHQRALVVLLLLIVIVIYMKMVNKISWKHILIFAVTLLVFFEAQLFFKSMVKGGLSISDRGQNGNDFSDQLSAATLLFTKDGIINFIYSLNGKIFAIITAYYLVPVYFIEQTIKELYFTLKRGLKGMRDINIFYLFLLFSLLGSIMIAAIFCLYPIRVDQVAYTRYSEYVMGPIMVVGLLMLGKIKICIKRDYIYLFILLISGIMVIYACYMLETTEFISLPTPVISIFYSKSNSELFAFAACFIFSIFFYFLSRIFNRWHLANCKYIILISMISFSFLAGYSAKSDFNKNDDVRREVKDLSCEIRNIESSTQNQILLKLVRGESPYL